MAASATIATRIPYSGSWRSRWRRASSGLRLASGGFGGGRGRAVRRRRRRVIGPSRPARATAAMNARPRAA